MGTGGQHAANLGRRLLRVQTAGVDRMTFATSVTRRLPRCARCRVDGGSMIGFHG